MNKWKPDYITNPLNAEDMAAIKVICKGFKARRKFGKVGVAHAISNDELSKAIAKWTDNKIVLNSARIRKLINYIRCTGLVPDLCASKKGYFVAANVVEFNTYLHESLYPRVMAQLHMIGKLKEHSSFKGLQEFDFKID